MPTKLKQSRQTKPALARTIRSVEDVIRMASSHSKSQFLYRGEDSTSYKLIPKVGRYEDASKEDWFESETSALSEFYRRSTPHLPSNQLSEIEILAIGQHHGLATRLLDWSQNPLVAVYFACLNPTIAGSRRIYALDTEDMYYIDGEESPFKQARVMLYEPNHLGPSSFRVERNIHGPGADGRVGRGSRLGQGWPQATRRAWP